jgi:hypothetical protein
MSDSQRGAGSRVRKIKITVMHIDCRPRAAYIQQHVDLAYNIPLAELTARAHELPPRHLTFTGTDRSFVGSRFGSRCGRDQLHPLADILSGIHSLRCMHDGSGDEQGPVGCSPLLVSRTAHQTMASRPLHRVRGCAAAATRLLASDRFQRTIRAGCNGPPALVTCRICNSSNASASPPTESSRFHCTRRFGWFE